MGMSASQVRFLSLQHRKHNVGRQLNALSNRKMSLARDMQQVSRNYTNALNQINLKFSNNSGMNNYDLSYDLLMKPNALNCETPYIITDREGRVVVDDKEITYEKDGQTVNTGVSYRQLAQLISSYSGVDDDGNIIYNATERLADFSGALFGENGYSINKAATSGLACGVDNGYKIAMKQSDYDYSIAMRYDILNRLGIITEDEYNNFGAIQKAYYGTKDARDNNLYATVAINDTKGTAAFRDAAENESLKDVFGVLNVSDAGVVDIEGGCTLGNLEIAKMYLKEYEDLYLNTNIKQRSTPDSWAYKNDYKTDLHDYTYDSYLLSDRPNQGVTNRIMNLLTDFNPTLLDSDGNPYSDSVDSRGIYKDGENLLSQSPTIRFNNMFAGNGLDNEGRDSGKTDCTGFVYYVRWNTYDKFFCSEKSTDASSNLSAFFNAGELSDKYKEGEGHGDVYACITDLYVDGDSDWNSSAGNLVCNVGNLYSLVDSIKNSVGGIYQGNINGALREEAGQWAKYMTICKFMNNYRVLNDNGQGGATLSEKIKNNIEYARENPASCRTSGQPNGTYMIYAQSWEFDSTSFDRTNRSIIRDFFQLSELAGHNATSNGITANTSDTSPTERYIEYYVNMTNLINTYLTFYTAYIETNMDKKSSVDYAEPAVIWKDENNNYISNYGDVGFEGSAENYTTRLSSVTSQFDFTNIAITTTKYYDDKGNSKYVYEDKNGDGKDDTTGKTMTDPYWSGVTASSLGISTDTYNYLSSFVVEPKTDSDGNPKIDEKGNVIYNYDIGNAYKVGSKASTNSAVISELDSFVSNISGTPDYTNIKKMLRAIKENELQHTVTSSESEYAIVTQEKSILGGTAVATEKVDTSTGKIMSYEVDYQYTSTPAEGAPLKYTETYDATGNLTNARLTRYSTDTSGKNPIKNIVSSNISGEQDEILACQVQGASTYVIGRGAGYDTTYCNYLYTCPEDTADYITRLKDLVKRLEEQAAEQQKQMQDSFNNIENKVMEYFDTLFKRISENGWVYDEKVNTDNTKASANYLNTMLQNNQYLLTEAREINENGKYQYAMKQATSVNKIYQVHDEDAENAALAVYESEKTAISNKERQIDTRMNMLETEQEAINTELESIKKVRNDNIDKYFKIFA